MRIGKKFFEKEAFSAADVEKEKVTEAATEGGAEDGGATEGGATEGGADEGGKVFEDASETPKKGKVGRPSKK